MNTVEQINQICLETDNEWFLMHEFTKVSLHDIKLKAAFEAENTFNFDGRNCICQEDWHEGKECISCNVEIQRSEELDKLYLYKNLVYDFEESNYIKSKWIIPDKINGEIPGFILIKCCSNSSQVEGYNHELVFACVRPKYREKGILKSMVNSIPKEWNVWLEANSSEIKDVEKIWEKCGFSYKMTLRQHVIYTKNGMV